MNGAPLFYTPKIVGFMAYQPRAEAAIILHHVEKVLADYAENLPLTLRQVYYRLVATHDRYPKTDVFYEKLGVILARARRGGLIPWHVIRDDGVQSIECGGGFNGFDDFLAAVKGAAKNYCRDKRQGQPRQILLLCEAAGMVPQMRSAAGDYPVTIRTCGGMDSVTAKYGLAEICAERDTTILHIGDWDPSGLSIFHGIVHDVGTMAREICRESLERIPAFNPVRVTILPEHVERHGLLTGVVKQSDKAKGWYPGIGDNPHATCEAESLPPDLLVEMVRSAIEAEVDLTAYRDALVREADERGRAIATTSEIGGARS